VAGVGARRGVLILTVLADILTVIAPVFLIAAAGYGWVRLGRPFDSVFVTEVVTHVAAPCLVFATLTRMRFGADALGEMVLATMATSAGFAVVGVAALKAARLPLRAFLPSLMFPNTGNMGLPLCLFAFGDEGLALAIVYFTTTTVIHFTGGVAIVMGSVDLRRLLRLPILHATALALIFLGFDIPVPEWLANTTGLLGQLAVPLMLMALGVALGQLQVAGLARTAALSVLRLAMGAGVAWAVAWALGLGPQAAGVLVIQSAMPTAVFNYLFAQKFNVRPGEVASIVLISTALSFVTLPLLLALVL